ncbi:MAG: flagellar hook-associated protein FlgL [Gemmatimonadota bacterium]
MRITNIVRSEQAIREIQNNLSRLSQLQSQISTGKRFTRSEEDPAGAAQVMRIQSGLRALEQYGKNSTLAQIRSGAEGAVVKQVGELLRDGRNFALSFAKGDPPYTTDQINQRQIAANQLDSILNQVISLGNTQIGNEYILSGTDSTTPPFDPNPGATQGNYQGSVNPRLTTIGDGVQISPNHTGDQYLAPAIAALKALRDAADPANNQTEAQVQAAVTTVFDTADRLLVSEAQTGVVGKQIITNLASQAIIKNDLEDVRSNVQDISLEEASARLLSLQTTIQASYAATSRLLSLNLTDFLR